MRFLADEGVDRPIVEALRACGHDVEYVLETSRGISDVEVLERANGTDSILLTQDKDFGELVYRRGLAHNGVVLLRLAGSTATEKARTVVDFVLAHGNELHDAFVVVSREATRIRR